MHLTIAASFNASALYNSVISGENALKSISVRVMVGDEYLMSSLPVSAILPGVSQVEQITVTTDSFNQPMGITYRLKRALGSPLFSTSLVYVVHPTVLPGPFVSDVDLAIHTPETSATSSEEPSLLKKYWWVLLGVILLSSAFNSGGEPSSK